MVIILYQLRIRICHGACSSVDRSLVRLELLVSGENWTPESCVDRLLSIFTYGYRLNMISFNIVSRCIEDYTDYLVVMKYLLDDRVSACGVVYSQANTKYLANMRWFYYVFLLVITLEFGPVSILYSSAEVYLTH